MEEFLARNDVKNDAFSTKAWEAEKQKLEDRIKAAERGTASAARAFEFLQKEGKTEES